MGAVCFSAILSGLFGSQEIVVKLHKEAKINMTWLVATSR